MKCTVIHNQYLHLKFQRPQQSFTSILKSLIVESINQSINQLINQSINQSIKNFIYSWFSSSYNTNLYQLFAYITL